LVELILKARGARQDHLPVQPQDRVPRLVLKLDRVRRPDVVIAYKTASGLHLGKWVYRARVHVGSAHLLIFAHPDGSPWTSRYFRKAHLYPFLYQRQVLGDPYLTPYSGGRGNSIEENFWSLHCYRRGARSHVEAIECDLPGMEPRRSHPDNPQLPLTGRPTNPTVTQAPWLS
jgi:hypothetical protein